MIVNSLKNSDKYDHIHPLFKQAFEYLKSTNFVNAELGKVELVGKDLFVLVSDSSMKTFDTAKLEVHDKYIDIQVPISKSETFGWMAREDMNQKEGLFDEQKDIQFFLDKASTFVTLSPDNFIVFFPQDGHAPCIGEGTIRKVVVKIKI